MEIQFLLTPLREGRHVLLSRLARLPNFYSRPCGRGDIKTVVNIYCETSISTHAPAGGATSSSDRPSALHIAFLLTPLREGRRWLPSR